MHTSRSRTASLLLALLLVLSSVATSAQAQEREAAEVPVSFCPWNSHDFAPDATPYTSAPSLEVASAFMNIRITTSNRFHTECSIAVNPKDSLNMIVEEIDGNFPENGIYVSRDGGATWHASLLPSESGLFSNGDPWVTFDANGIAYACQLQSGFGVHLRLPVYRSSDNGETWTVDAHMMDYGALDTTADEPVLGIDRNAASPYFNSLYAMTASQGQIPFLGAGPVGIHLQFRRAGASILSAQAKTSQIGLAQVPHFTFGLHGEIYIAYIGITDILNLGGGLYFNASTDGGATWSKDLVIAASNYTDTIKGFPKQGSPLPASRMGPTPRIVIDTSNGPRRGWLYVAYAMPASADHKQNLDIFMQRSTDGGVNWSQAVRVNDDPIASLNDQLTPCLAINPDGVLGVVFYDRRDDPNNFLLQTYIAISSDGGTTWANQRLSSASTDPMAARKQISLAVADYISIAATRSAFYPIWNDGRKNNGDLDTYIARVPIGTAGAAGAAATATTGPSISIYPNPLVDASHIAFEAKRGERVHFGIYDVLGREVMKLNDIVATGSNQTFALDVNSLPAGTYLLRSDAGGVRASVRFVKMR